MQPDDVVIAGMARTPIGGFLGGLGGVRAPDLGAAAIRAALDRAGADPAALDQTLMGCVLAAGLGQAPARQAARAASIPDAVGATTINKMCGSGMQAAILAHDMLKAGSAGLVVAGGMESMSNAPYALARHRTGARFGHDRAIDTLLFDGLEDAYEPGQAMGVFAEAAAAAHGIGRAEQDAFALRSLERARAAGASGAFADEIVAVPLPDGRVIAADEQPARADPARIPRMKPAFAEGGTITAANASSISDGAAALVLARADRARALGLPILARVAGHGAHAQAPGLFTTAPAPAIARLLDRLGWSVDSVDLFEVNEAFAVVALLAAEALAIPDDRLNIHGGATALGHPIGASGARIIVTMLAALQRHGGMRGVAAVCIGGGEATAIAIERV